jgi:GNAT superfamily N-acetyltransferase
MSASAAVHVRGALAIDHADIVRCVDGAYSPYVEVMGAPPAPMLDDYGRLIDEGRVWVAEAGGELAGVIVMWPEESHWYVDNIAVDPRRHGQGIGSVLLESAEQTARLAGRTEIRLYTNEAMTTNLGYYARRGFIETHRAVHGGYRRVFYRRPVPPSAR